MTSDNVGIRIGMFVLFLAVIVVAIIVRIKRDADWELFSHQHHCRIFSYRNTGRLGLGSRGDFMTSPIPAHNGYLCDDGVTYWR